MAVNSGLTEQV